MNARKKITTIILAVFVLLTLVAAAPTPAMELVAGCKQTHTVVGGEYLSKIATLYGVNWYDLATLNKLADANLIYPGQVLCISVTTVPVVPTPISQPTGSVRVSASAAVEDKSVTLKGKLLDANSSYTVYMSNYKLAVPVNILAGVANTDASGNFTQTFSIPKALTDVALIRVYLINSRGDSTSNWFINTTASGNLGGFGSSALTISIDDVKEDDWVKITVNNLPANVTFDVIIGKAESEGNGGYFVGHIHSTSGGKVTATFDLPAELLDRSKLDILVENDAVNMSAFKTFDNN